MRKKKLVKICIGWPVVMVVLSLGLFGRYCFFLVASRVFPDSFFLFFLLLLCFFANYQKRKDQDCRQGGKSQRFKTGRSPPPADYGLSSALLLLA